jgi:mRNA interferase YafQ
MRIPKTTKQFRRHYTKLKRSGKNLTKLNALMQLLIRGDRLPAKYRDHALHGEWQYVRDCHVEGDWVLLYGFGIDAEKKETVTFYATGTHEQLFG